MNGLGLEESFDEWADEQPIFGGMAFTCINRGAPGEVHHLRYGALTIGHHGDNPATVEEALALWDGSKVEVHGTDALLRARWEKLAWNIPFNGLAVAAGGITTDRIVGDAGLRDAARVAMEEVVRAGNADLAAHHEPARCDGPALIDRMFALTDAMGVYRPSTMIDFVNGRRMEIDAIFDEPVRRAVACGVEVPYMRLLAVLLRVLDVRAGGA